MNMPMPSLPLPRHARVWLEWPASSPVVTVADENHRAAIEAHAGRGHPFVARRRQPCDVADGVPLGLRLPRGHAVRSLPLCVPAAAIHEVADAMPLAEALEHELAIPPTWRQTLQSLVRQMQDIDVVPRIYGSLAWQIGTGVAYLADDSDLDLLVRPASMEQAKACLDILNETSCSAAMHLDGEMEFPDGSAVAWKELAGGATKMLIKKNDGVALVETESIWNQCGWQ